MLIVEAGLWLAVAVIVHAYFGYPVMLIGLAAIRQCVSDWRYQSAGRTRRVREPTRSPSVAVLVAAHDEERHIEARVRNLLALDYPVDRLRIDVGSDGSTDATGALLSSLQSPRVSVRLFERRRGKASVVNDLAARATEDILVLTDANTTFAPDTVAKLVRHFADPTVGIVCGELRLVPVPGSRNRDHVYWRFERFLKALEGRVGALLGANGGVYAIRRSCFRPVPADTICEDFCIAMEVTRSGYRAVYDPEALAHEVTPAKLKSEFDRRVRIGIGNYQALARFAGILRPSYGITAIAFLSHKVLRWLAPHCMVAILVLNVLLLEQPGYRWLLGAQLAFYGLAIVGLVRSAPGALAGVPAFFVGMNLALLVGSWRYLRGSFDATWTRTER